MISLVANHLWQSTIFALAAALLSLALKQNQARTLHAIWLAASVKFLIPFALLIAAGNHLQWHKVPAAPARFSVAIEQISQPFPSLPRGPLAAQSDRKSTRLNSSHLGISYA